MLLPLLTRSDSGQCLFAFSFYTSQRETVTHYSTKKYTTYLITNIMQDRHFVLRENATVYMQQELVEEGQ